MVEYNPEVLKRYADRLYVQAYLLVLVWTLVGAGIGAVISAVVPVRGLSHDEQSMLAGGLWIGLTVVGFLFGWSQCMSLRIKAQQILCQVAIESNTRVFAQPRAEQRRIA